MKKAIVVALCVGLIAGMFAAPAAAQKKKKKKKPVKIERVVEFDYNCPCTGRIQLGTLTDDGTNIGGGAIPTGLNDVYMTAVIEDEFGQPVRVNFNQIGGDGLNASIGTMCGETEEPIEVPARGANINVFINGNDPTCGVGAIGGTLTVTFSNLP
jgi:hypothetical protein